MARRPFGGTSADIAEDARGNVQGSATGTAWTAQTGGVQVTDLQSAAGVALPSGVITASSSGLVQFLGPVDGTSELWVDFGGGRQLMLATDIPDRVALLESNPAGGTAATTTFAPASGIAATDVQAAIVEVVADAATTYVQKAGTETITGAWTFTTPPSGIPTGTGGSSQPFGRALQGIGEANERKFRVLQFGTSNSTFISSSNHIFVNRLRDLYGEARVSRTFAGILGGSYNVTFGGWVKQAFGGLLFRRSRGDNTSTALTFDGVCDQVTVEYSKETDGGSFTVAYEGGTLGTINCNGAQSYGNQVTYTLPTLGPHRITINSPASGYAYFESVALADSTSLGIDAVSPLNASSLRNTIVNATGPATAAIPIVGMNGVDAHFGRTDIDLIICMHLVNDAGQGTYNDPTQWRDLVDRAIVKTRETDTPLIWIIEMGGHFARATDSQYATYVAMRAYLLAKAADPDNNHFYALDWHAMTVQDDMTAYAAAYYPTAVITSPTAYTGDWIHPTEPGHRVATAALCALVGISPPDYDRTTEADEARKVAEASGPVEPTVDGTTRTYEVPWGTAHKYAFGAVHYVPYYRDDTAINWAQAIQTEIDASVTSDADGTYKTYAAAGVTFGAFPFSSGRRLVVTARAKGTIALRMFNARFWVDGVQIPVSDSTLNLAVTSTTPVVVTAEVGASADGLGIIITGDFYEFSAVESDVPVLVRTAEVVTTLNPETITGLVAWYDAAAQVGTDGANVQADDRSGVGNTATNATVAARPRYRTNIRNSLPVFRFDGANDVLAIPSLTRRTYFAVIKITASSPYTQFFGILGETADGDRSIRTDTGTANIRTGGPTWINGVLQGAPIPFASNTYKVVTVRLAADSTQALHFGKGVAATNVFWPGDCAELLIYSTSLSDVDRAAVEAYLMTKWAIT